MAKTWKEPKCQLTEEWIKKICVCVCVCVCVMEYYSAVKNNEITSFAATWTDLESVILSEVRQREKEKYCMTSLICGI